MSRFNLNTLAKCGATTRQGTPCQRLGNKRNGRCKLHGGRSTGAKTQEGKLALRANPLLSSIKWHVDQQIPLRYIQKAIKTYLQLVELANDTTTSNDDINRHVLALVASNRIELECCKYAIAAQKGDHALLVLQSALDLFYKDSAADHLHFHIYTPIAAAPYFKQLVSKTQQQAYIAWDARLIRHGKGIW